MRSVRLLASRCLEEREEPDRDTQKTTGVDDVWKLEVFLELSMKRSHLGEAKWDMFG